MIFDVVLIVQRDGDGRSDGFAFRFSALLHTGASDLVAVLQLSVKAISLRAEK